MLLILLEKDDLGIICPANRSSLKYIYMRAPAELFSFVTLAAKYVELDMVLVSTPAVFIICFFISNVKF